MKKCGFKRIAAGLSGCFRDKKFRRILLGAVLAAVFSITASQVLYAGQIQRQIAGR